MKPPKFCPDCGTPLESSTDDHDLSNPTPLTVVFCPYCGWFPEQDEDD